MNKFYSVTNIRQTPEWVDAGQISAAGSEIRYWKERGIDLGTEIYDRYLHAFKLQASDISDKVVADFGCGPFGGILTAMDVDTPYPVDVLADEYNQWGHSRHPIVGFDGIRTEIGGGVCDIVISCNALDHTPDPQPSINEIARILKPGGQFFLHVHLRHPHELNKAHPVSWSREFATQKLKAFDVVWCEEHAEDWVNEKPYRTLLMELRKPDV